MSTPPKITLITVVRNGAAFIEHCLQSVVEQNYPNLEYIVMDGASTDGTQAIIERNRSHITIYHSRPDNGAYDAAQQAFSFVTGDIVGYLMADDWLAPHALATLAAMYNARPQADIFCFSMQEYKKDETGALQKTKYFSDPAGDVFTLADSLYCQGINRFYSGRIIKEEGYFREELYKNLADRDFYMRLGIRNISKAWTDKVLYNFLTHAGSNSTGGPPSKIVKFLDETCTIAEDYARKPTISAEDRKRLNHWYCFNAVRSVWFRLKGGRYGAAFMRSLCLLVYRPLGIAKALINWKMPEAYRAKHD